MGRKIATLALLAGLCGCTITRGPLAEAEPGMVAERSSIVTDDFDGSLSLSAPLLGQPINGLGAKLFFHRDRAAVQSARLLVHYNGRDWLFAESVLVKDGAPLPVLKIDQSASPYSVTEYVTCELDNATVRRGLSGGLVVRLSGQRGYETIEIPPWYFGEALAAWEAAMAGAPAVTPAVPAVTPDVPRAPPAP